MTKFYTLASLILITPAIINIKKLLTYNCFFYNSYLTCQGHPSIYVRSADTLFLLGVFILMIMGYLKILLGTSVKPTSTPGVENTLARGFRIFLPIFILFLVPPIGSTDIFFYKALSEVRNPFISESVKINPFISEGSIGIIKNVMYAPLWLFINKILAGSIKNIIIAVYSYKMLMTLSHFINYVLIKKSLRMLKTKNYNFLAYIYLLNPLLIFEFIVNGHFDVIMLTFILLGIYFFVKKGQFFYELGFLSLTTATLIKYTAVFTIPIFTAFLLTRKRLSWIYRIRKLVLSALISITAVVLTFKPYWIGTKIFEGINRQSDWAVNSLFSAVYTPIYTAYEKFTGRIIYSRSFRDLWILFGIIFLTQMVRLLPTFWKFLTSKSDKNVVSIHYILYSSTLLYFFYLVFIQRSFWPWYVSWVLVFIPFIHNRYTTLSNTTLILSTTSLLLYLMQTFLGPWGLHPLSLGQTVIGLSIFIPPLIYWAKNKMLLNPFEIEQPLT